VTREVTKERQAEEECTRLRKTAAGIAQSARQAEERQQLNYSTIAMMMFKVYFRRG
jgi:hypothetical protein